MITHILFDLGHVLIPADSTKAMEYFINDCNISEDILNKFLFDTKEHDDFCRGLLTSDEYYQALSAYLQPDLNPEDRLTLEQIKYGLGLHILPHDKELVKVLHRCKAQGYKIVIVTDTHEWQSEHFRASLDFDSLADVVFESHILGKLKDDADCFSIICEKLNIEPSAALLIDDKPINNELAASIGMQAPGYQNVEQITKYLINNINLTEK